MIFWYKNSFLASVVSIAGSIIGLSGIAMINNDEPVVGVLMIIGGIAMIIVGKIISNDTAFKKWWKQVTDANLEPQIAQNISTAIAIYNKNPQKRTLKKIAALNPAAAEQIERSLGAKK